MHQRTKKLTSVAMLCAVSYLVVVVFRIPVVLFLKYEPKDIIITIGGFLFGPLSAFAISAVVSFVEMLTVSDTGWIGFVMNVIASCAFACTASFIYKRRRSLSGAVIGLILGGVCMTAAMLLWNYFLTPLYMGYPREEVAAMLVPVFLPFNLLKSGLNAALTLLIYKPVVGALRRSNLIPAAEHGKPGQANVGAMLASALVLVSCILLILILKGAM